MSAGAIGTKGARTAPRGGGLTLWLTGLPAAGKTTLASGLIEVLEEEGRAACLLDGDVLRAGGSRELGFSPADRAEQARRATAMAVECATVGLVAVVALVSPYRRDRDLARATHAAHHVRFAEVYVATPLAECERRDPKGLYARARRGEITDFTGVNDPYEPPRDPELRVLSHGTSPAQIARSMLRSLDVRVA
jgi:adenylyl-sulfate kinase